MARLSPMCPMPEYTRPTVVPNSMKATYAVITALTDVLCREHLNEEYRVLYQRSQRLTDVGPFSHAD
jgi:hypothetical protein